MMNGDFELLATPHGLREPEIDLHLNGKALLHPQNDFLPSQKLQYALEMAEAVSLLRKF
jgi:hypothetical protein